MELIYAIPGLGTTHELFENIAVPNFRLNVLQWPLPQPGWSLEDYAKAFLDQVDTSAPVNLLGVSFGGMLCCELAEMIRVKKVVLISSCKNQSELPPHLKFLKHIPFQKLISEDSYRRFSSSMCRVVGFKKDYLPKFIGMMRTMPPHYYSYCIDMIISWDRQANTQPVYHIHGNNDNLLPHRYIKNYETIQNGNHAMVLYRAQEINTLLNRFFNGV